MDLFKILQLIHHPGALVGGPEGNVCETFIRVQGGLSLRCAPLVPDFSVYIECLNTFLSGLH